MRNMASQAAPRDAWTRRPYERSDQSSVRKSAGQRDQHHGRGVACSKSGTVLLVVFAVATLNVPSADAKVYEDNIISADNWVFLDHFAFDTTGKGKIKWEVQVDAYTEDGSEGVGEKTNECSGCLLKYGGDLVSGGCPRLANVNRTWMTVGGKQECMVPNVSPRYSLVTCADWDSGWSMDWAQCVERSKATTKLLFYNDVDGLLSEWFDVYQSTGTCDEKSARAALAVNVERGLVVTNELPVLKSVVPHFWYVVLANCQAQARGYNDPYALRAKVKLWFWNDGWDGEADSESCSGEAQNPQH